MKRAKLTKVPFSGSASGADLTDRLLGEEPAAVKSKQTAKSKTKKAKKMAATEPSVKPAPAPKEPRSRKRATVTKQAETGAPPATQPAADLPTYTPYRTVEPRPAVTPGPALAPPESTLLPADTPKELRAALAATEKALAALVAAAEAAPARHDLAVRYRLDALRQHLRQVSDFLATRK